MTWPAPEGAVASDYFGALLPAYSREGDAVSVAAAGAWLADVALHADLIARPARLGLAEGVVTVADRSVPLRVGVELPPGLVMPVTAAVLRGWTEGRASATALVRVSATTVRAWDSGAVARMGLDEAAAAAEWERRRYFVALCRCVRETTYDAVDAAAPAAERAGGVPLGPLAGGSVLMVGEGAAQFFDVVKDRAADIPSPARDRERREKIAAAARAYVGRLAAYEASGRRDLAAPGEVERAAAADVERAAAGELLLWQLAAGTASTRSTRAESGFKLGMVGKLAVGLFVVKTVLAD